MTRTAWSLLLLNLGAVLALVIALPHPMVAPGDLSRSHAPQEADCWSCHAPLQGASAERCVACHRIDDIGLRDVAGALLPASDRAVAFHQALAEADCVACHSDHAGVVRYRGATRFSHELLEPHTGRDCASCHTSPTDDVHAALTGQCSDCHQTAGWTPATFDHARLSAAQRSDCASCHGPDTPQDNLHAQVGPACGECHKTTAWTPATFDHADFFQLDRDHNARCDTCHTNADYKQYTCYGCHEHTERKIRSEHEEEGIRDFSNCVECHRNADEDDAKRRWRGSSGGRGERGGDDD